MDLVEKLKAMRPNIFLVQVCGWDDDSFDIPVGIADSMENANALAEELIRKDEDNLVDTVEILGFKVNSEDLGVVVKCWERKEKEAGFYLRMEHICEEDCEYDVHYNENGERERW